MFIVKALANLFQLVVTGKSRCDWHLGDGGRKMIKNRQC